MCWWGSVWGGWASEFEFGCRVDDWIGVSCSKYMIEVYGNCVNVENNIWIDKYELYTNNINVNEYTTALMQ